MTRIIAQLQTSFNTSFLGKYILRLAILYFLFRSVNWLWVGLITPGGRYSAFIDHYLDYVTLIKISVLHAGRFLADLLGTATLFINDNILQVANGGRVRMAWACCGLEIMSFWLAFVLADTTSIAKKIFWGIGGLAMIFIINSVRIAVLVIAQQERWRGLLKMDHHDVFNYVAYFFLLVLMFVYYQKNKQVFQGNNRLVTQ